MSAVDVSYKTLKLVGKASKQPIRTSRQKIDVEQLILQKRYVLLHGEVTHDTANNVIKQLLALDQLCKGKTPITLWIDSYGGGVLSGFAILDTIQLICSPVVTIISGAALSIAGIISICGVKRGMTKHSIWMAHDVHSYIGNEYATKLTDRIGAISWCQRKVFELLRAKTKLSETEIEKARRGELWLDADECISKGVVDIIL